MLLRLSSCAQLNLFAWKQHPEASPCGAEPATISLVEASWQGKQFQDVALSLGTYFVHVDHRRGIHRLGICKPSREWNGEMLMKFIKKNMLRRP